MTNACALVALEGTAINDLDVELIIRVDLLHYTSANTHDLQHACGSTTKYDDCQHDHYEYSSTKRVAVVACQTRCKSHTHSATQSSPVDHGLVCVWYFLFCRFYTTTPLAVSGNGVDSLGQREHGCPASGTDTSHCNEDEERLEVKLFVSEERKSEIDEDEVLRQLRRDLKNELRGQLGAPGHVVVGVMFEADAAEQK